MNKKCPTFKADRRCPLFKEPFNSDYVMRKTIFYFIFFVLLFLACRNRSRTISLPNTNALVETQLGTSGYRVKHPVTMQLSVGEFRQAGDDHTFVFSKADSLAPFSNVFAIGLNVPDSSHSFGFNLPVVEQVRSEVLGTVVNWNVHKSDTGYFVADARLRDMKFVATSVTQAGIDSMIALVSTLSSR
jgi:hypothetical protein